MTSSLTAKDYPRPTPLPVFSIVRAAFQFVWDKKARLLRALAVPVVLMFVADHAFTFAKDDFMQLIPHFFQTLIFILFAITCHRLALLGDQDVPDYGMLTWTKREWQYLGWVLVIMVICMLISFVTTSLIASSIIKNVEAGARVESFQFTRSLFYLAFIPVMYILCRLSVLYPAIALDQEVSARWAWQLTAHNGWRMTLIVGLLPWVLYIPINLLLRENATLVENTIAELLGFVLLAVEVIALSFSYQHLAQAEAEAQTERAE